MDFIKKIALFLILFSTALGVNGQHTDKVTDEPDKELLLEYYQTQRYAEAATYLAPFYKEGKDR